MKKLFLSLTVTALIAFTSCQKKDFFEKGRSMHHEVASEEAHIHLPVAGYEIRIAQPLTSPGDYLFNTNGVMEYVINNEVLATVDFGNGELDAIAKKAMDGTDEDIDLTQPQKTEDDDCDGGKDCDKDFDFDKIIEHPLVTVDGCDYIVSGIIKYYKDGDWVATFDYGDGTCDEWVTKTTLDGVSDFSLDEFQGWN
jgi:hypothetical protein